MKRFYEANAVETPPSPPVSPSYGYPQNGNRAKNQFPTTVGAYWFHMVTEELMAVIEDAGIVPDERNLHQLADIFRDFKNKAQSAESAKKDAEAAAQRAEAAANGVVTETESKIKQIQQAGADQVAAVQNVGNGIADEVATARATISVAQNESIAAVQAASGQEQSALETKTAESLERIHRETEDILDIQSASELRLALSQCIIELGGVTP